MLLTHTHTQHRALHIHQCCWVISPHLHTMQAEWQTRRGRWEKAGEIRTNNKEESASIKLAPSETLHGPSIHTNTLKVFMRTRRMFSATRQRVVTIGGRAVNTMMSLHYHQPAHNIMTSRPFFLFYSCISQNIIIISFF